MVILDIIGDRYLKQPINSTIRVNHCKIRLEEEAFSSTSMSDIGRSFAALVTHSHTAIESNTSPQSFRILYKYIEIPSLHHQQSSHTLRHRHPHPPSSILTRAQTHTRFLEHSTCRSKLRKSLPPTRCSRRRTCIQWMSIKRTRS